MIQQIIVLLVFAAALGYLGYRGWRALQRPTTGGCAKGCGCETPGSGTKVASQANSRV